MTGSNYVTKGEREIFDSLTNEQVLAMFEVVSEDKDKDHEHHRIYLIWADEVLRRMER